MIRPKMAPARAAPLLRLDCVNAGYGAVLALSGVSLDVTSGEIVCLLGSNASGKSTTIKVALGLIRPRSGRVLLDERDVTGSSTARIIRSGVASVPEARRVFAQMSVEENLKMGAFVRRDTRAIAQDQAEMLELFPALARARHRQAGTLSGGEQQMLAMARALMSRPRLLCMDEPTMGLAPIFVDRVLDHIVAINARGTAILLVEQNASLALSIAHRGYVLQSGRIVLNGSAPELLASAAIKEAYLGQRGTPAGQRSTNGAN